MANNAAFILLSNVELLKLHRHAIVLVMLRTVLLFHRHVGMLRT